jgi:hypothetical protein
MTTQFDFKPRKGIEPLTGIDEILKKPLIADVILVGLTSEEGIREMKDEGFVPLGWEASDYGTTKEDRQAGGSEDEAEG